MRPTPRPRPREATVRRDSELFWRVVKAGQRYSKLAEFESQIGICNL